MCRLSKTGDKVSALVGGAKVADVAHQSAIHEIRAAGFAGTVPEGASGPGDWTGASFSRDVPGGN